MKRPFAVAAAVAGIATLGFFVTPANAQQAAGVDLTGHLCGTNNYGTAPKCTYQTTEATGYEGIGPFKITSRRPDCTIKVWKNCPANTRCGTTIARPIPRGTTITVSVSAAPGSAGDDDV